MIDVCAFRQQRTSNLEASISLISRCRYSHPNIVEHIFKKFVKECKVACPKVCHYLIDNLYPGYRCFLNCVFNYPRLKLVPFGFVNGQPFLDLFQFQGSIEPVVWFDITRWRDQTRPVLAPLATYSRFPSPVVPLRLKGLKNRPNLVLNKDGNPFLTPAEPPVNDDEIGFTVLV